MCVDMCEDTCVDMYVGAHGRHDFEQEYGLGTARCLALLLFSAEVIVVLAFVVNLLLVRVAGARLALR